MEIQDETLRSERWKLFVYHVLRQLSDLPAFQLGTEMRAESAARALAACGLLVSGESLLGLCEVFNPTGSITTLAFTTHRLSIDGPDALSIAYRDLPTPIFVIGMLEQQLVIGDRKIAIGLSRSTLERLVIVLDQIAAGTHADDPLAPPDDDGRKVTDFTRFLSAQPSVQNNPVSAPASIAGAPLGRLLVTPFLILASVVVEVIMISRGVSVANPTVADLHDWGGGMGVSLALDHEYWRLFTPIFLHGGLPHLAFNMLFLWQFGRVVERLYGAVGFLLIYLFSGLFGMVASAWWHPQVVAVGASGAIFGTLGALIIFLVLHRATIPRNALQSVRGSVIVLLLYNLLPGFLIKEIDSAAHVGGLLGGLITGLFLSRPWPVSTPNQGLPRQLAFSLIPLFAFCGTTYFVVQDIPRKAPEVVAAIAEERLAVHKARAFNNFKSSLQPLLEEFDRLVESYDKIVTRVSEAPARVDLIMPQLTRLTDDVKAIGANLKAVPVADPELSPLRDELVVGLNEFEAMARRLISALQPKADRQALLDGPDGMTVHRKKYESAVERYEQLTKNFMNKHQLKETAAPGGPPKS